LVELATVWDALLSDTAKQTAFKWDAAKCSPVVLLIGTFFEKREAYLADRTKAKRLTKDKAKKAAMKAMRVFANDAVRFNDLMTLEDKLLMGIGPVDETETAQGDPDRPPVFTLKPRDYCQVAAVVRADGTTRIAIPDWAAGVVLLLQIGGERPASPDDLPSIRLITRARYTIRFAAKDSGKKAYVSFQWQNTTGVKGQAAPIQEIVIP
jgi:hypothetical protein